MVKGAVGICTKISETPECVPFPVHTLSYTDPLWTSTEGKKFWHREEEQEQSDGHTQQQQGGETKT